MSRRSNSRLGTMSFGLSLLVATSPALGSTMSWNVGNGSFHTASNWTGGIPIINPPPPNSNDVARFGRSINQFQLVYAVSFSSNVTTQGLVVEDDLVTLDLNGRVWLTTTTTPITIGSTPGLFGSLTITDGNLGATAENSRLVLGDGGAGVLVVSTGGLLAGSAMDVAIGGAGGGQLTVQSGGTAVVEDLLIGSSVGGPSTNLARITGASSGMLASRVIVGQAGAGTLRISAGGVLESDVAILGDFAGSSGMAFVENANSRWINSGALTVGQVGNGSLLVGNGGRVTSESAFLGILEGVQGNATVTGANSQWSTTGDFTVGNLGQGTLNVTAGGVVSSSNGHVGSAPGSSGVVIIDGPGSRWSSMGSGFGFEVGFEGSGTLDVRNGGSLETVGAIVGRRLGAVGVVTVDGPGSRWTNAGPALLLGFGGAATVNILNGGEVSNENGFVGSDDTVTVNGVNSRWINGGDLVVGNLTGGALHVTGGGAVFSLQGFVNSESGPAAAVTIDGPGSTWTIGGPLAVGSNSLGGAGAVTIQNGGALTSNAGILGKDAPTSGTVTVTRDGSLWSVPVVDSFDVGSSGAGTLNVTAGGDVTTVGGRIGLLAGSTGAVTVDGAGSQWLYQPGGFLHVGVHGTGQLNVTGGGALTGGAGILGLETGGDGAVTVSGTGSTWTVTGSIVAGRRGAGEMTIAAGGLATSQFGFIGDEAGSSGVVAVDGAGSRWHVDQTIAVGAAGSGSLVVTNQGRVEALQINVGALGQLSGDGVVAANVQNGGVISPGASAGLLRIDDTLAQLPGGSLDIELGGLTRGTEYDAVDVAFGAFLDGTLNVSLIDGFMPAAGQSFDLLNANLIMGAFATLNLPALTAGLTWNTTQLHTTGVLAVGVAGDFDLDGDVDGADVLVWQRGGSPSPNSPGDLADWQSNFGFAAATAATAAMPEPAICWLVAVATMFVASRGRPASASALIPGRPPGKSARLIQGVDSGLSNWQEGEKQR